MTNAFSPSTTLRPSITVYSRSEFEKLTIRSLQAFDVEPPWAGEHAVDERAARTWKHVRADGALIDLAIYSRQLVYGDRPAALLALMDTTERKRAEARLTFMAQHDGLTGLPNRDLLRQQMDDILLRTRRSAEQVAVLVLGLDHFKAVNDTLGHGIGDKLLRGVGKRLRSMLRDDDALARLNSDEFAIVQSGVTRPEDAAFLARRLLDAVGDPFLLDGHSVVIGASVGIAMSPGDGDESDKLLKNADLALSPYRFSRVGFSLLTKLFSGDRWALYPATMTWLILISLLACGFVFALIACDAGAHPAWGLLIAVVYPRSGSRCRPAFQSRSPARFSSAAICAFSAIDGAGRADSSPCRC